MESKLPNHQSAQLVGSSVCALTVHLWAGWGSWQALAAFPFCALLPLRWLCEHNHDVKVVYALDMGKASSYIYINIYLYVYAYIGLKSKWHIMKIWQRHAIEALLKQVRPLLFATRRCSRLSGREDIHDERKEWETPSWTIAVDHYHIKLLWLTFSSRCLLFVFWCLWSVFGALPLVWRNTLREITMQWLVGWSQLADPLAYISVVEQTCSPCWWHLPPTTHHCVENQGTQEAPFEPQLGGASVFVRKVRSQSSDWQTNTPRIAQRVTEERVRRKEDPTAWHVKEITLCSSEGLVVPDGWWH